MKTGTITGANGEKTSPVARTHGAERLPPKTLKLTKEESVVVKYLIDKIPTWARTTVEKRLAREFRNPKDGDFILTHPERFCIQNFIDHIPAKTRSVDEKRLYQKVIASYGS